MPRFIPSSPYPILALLFLWSACLGVPAHASSSMALDKGCFNCHGHPPRGKSPTFEQLSKDYARYRDKPQELLRQAEHLCAHRLLGGVPAHERLTTDEALRLIRWLAEGMP